MCDVIQMLIFMLYYIMYYIYIQNEFNIDGYQSKNRVFFESPAFK